MRDDVDEHEEGVGDDDGGGKSPAVRTLSYVLGRGGMFTYCVFVLEPIRGGKLRANKSERKAR